MDDKKLMDNKKAFEQKCPECSSTNLHWDRKRGEMHCNSCGYVVEDSMIDFSQEWREFDHDQIATRRRVGSPSTFKKHDKGLSTKIGKSGDLYKLSSSDRRKFYRLKKWQTRISTAIERNLKFALAELRRASSFLNIPDIAEEESARIYRMAAEKGLVRGRSMESVVAGALYAACRRHGVPRTLEEISSAFGLDKKEIGKTYRFICRQLGIRILPTSPLDYVFRFSSELDLNPETTSKAVEILNKAMKKEITSGKGPMGIAAAGLYVAALLCGEKKTQREVADVAGVTEVTIRNRYKELLEELDLENKIKDIKD
jgi:transcription initiation factor TFIIB